MSEAEPSEDTAQLFPKTVGEQLREARMALGLDLAEVAARTRIPQRHLEAIEQSDYSTLPSRTYALGFMKAYARAVGADEVKLSRALREEISDTYEPAAPRPEPQIHSPRRVPNGGVVIVGIIVALMLLGAAALYFGSSLFRGTEAPTDSAASTANELGIGPDGSPVAAPGASPTPTPVSGGQVALIAKNEVWVRIYDGAGNTLLMKTLAPGERYDVPADAKDPMINIGRPDQLTVLINGSEVAPLGPPERAIKDVRISADALRRRGQPDAVPSPAVAPGPAPVRSIPKATPKPRPRATTTPKPPIAQPLAAPAPAPSPFAPTGTP